MKEFASGDKSNTYLEFLLDFFNAWMLPIKGVKEKRHVVRKALWVVSAGIEPTSKV